MLPRKNLIALRQEFSAIRKEGKIYDSLSFGLIVAYSRQQPAVSAQAAFIVSKKISLKSTVRHNVKRKLAEAVHSLLPNLAKNLELVFLAKVRAVSASREEIRGEVEYALRRARLL